MNICDLVRRNGRLYPDEVALIELKPSQNYRKTITWRQFDAQVAGLASKLAEGGIGKSGKVIQLMTNSIDWLVCYFAILATGAWAVPLNFRFTSKDIEYCAEISEAKTMIFGPEFVERVESIKPQLRFIDRFIFAGDGGAPEGAESLSNLVFATSNPLSVPLEPEDVAGLYFTSGTTGEPKPIVLTHKNLMFAAVTEQKHHLQNRKDNFILLPPLYHTGAKMHWFGSLLAGSRATILREISPLNVLEAIDRERGTIVWLLVPWVQDILVGLDGGELKLSDYDLSSLRLMHIGAQPVPPDLVKRWKRYFPEVRYDTNYGLSESSGPGCVHLGMENEHKVGAIGKAGYRWQTRIVDDAGMDAGRGQVGELLVKGEGVMREYYKNHARTAETIRDGWLYTGDMAKMDDEGFIYIVDRKKDVIITGGENIYPVEIEEILISHPAVFDAAVIGIKDERLGEIPAAVISPKPGASMCEQDVTDFCEKHLPRYKRPRMVFFGQVPRNPTGKIEKPVLRARYSTG